MEDGDHTLQTSRLGSLAGRMFVGFELVAYLVLGMLLAFMVVVGIFRAAQSLWGSLADFASAAAYIQTIDRILFVLMVVEILHTVRDSVRSRVLVCEPFLIVGLIASIRRVLVITLEASQAGQPGGWNPNAQAQVSSTMLELSVLGGLILVLVISIYLLRRSDGVEK
jgi:uncharacterized membrane protein (DUF373 family)